MMTIYPEFIAPLFDKYTPLPDSELKTKIEALASRVEFPLKKLYVVQGKYFYFVNFNFHKINSKPFILKRTNYNKNENALFKYLWEGKLLFSMDF